MINKDIPVILANGDSARIIDYRQGEKYSIIGVHSRRLGAEYKMARWTDAGAPESGNPDHALMNKPGLRLLTLHINIYADCSSGWGYPSEVLAAKYAHIDSRLPVISRQKIKIILPKTPEPGQA